MLVVGLGNPGEYYAGTRHNVGFSVVTRVAERSGISMSKPFLRRFEYGSRKTEHGFLALARPLTYMNRSGDVIPVLLRRSGLAVSDMLVVCDTLDLEPGLLRLKRKGSSAGHRGLASIVNTIGTGEFLRLYVGIGHPANHGRVSADTGLQGIMPADGGPEGTTPADPASPESRRGQVVEYVLERPGDEERQALESATDRAADAVLSLLSRPIEEVMNVLNRR